MISIIIIYSHENKRKYAEYTIENDDSDSDKITRNFLELLYKKE